MENGQLSDEDSDDGREIDDNAESDYNQVDVVWIVL